MQKAWFSLLGVLGIALSCFGFAMNRSEAGVLGPGIWPGLPPLTDRRAAIKMFFNGKIHAADVDNILRDTETKKSVKEEERCPSCSDDPLRVRRSDDMLHMENGLKVNTQNALKVKESPIMPTSPSESKFSDVTSKSKTSTVFSKFETADATSESKTPHVATQSKTSHIATQSKTLRVTSESKTPHVTAESKSSDVTSESKSSDVTSESKSSDVTSESKSSDVTSESKSSDVTLQSKNSDATSEKSTGSKGPRNVILLLIDHIDREDTWKGLGAGNEIHFQGFLRNCRRLEASEDFKFPLDASLVSVRRNECECDRLLRANVGALLSWARHANDMTTGAVSATNFSIPSPFGYETLPSQMAKDFEDEVNIPKQDALRTATDLRTNWRLIELQKQSSLSSSTPTVVAESATKLDGENGFDGIWDIFDMFSRIRMAFFRILLESLGKLTGSEDEFSGRRPFPVQPNVVELVSDTVRELKSLTNGNGFMMVVAAPRKEMSAVVEVFQREVSPDNTLLVIVGMCSANDIDVPFFANGLGRKCLEEALTVWELPGLIKDAISNDCHGDIRMNKLPKEPPVLPLLQRWSFPDDFPRNRIARAKEADQTTSPSGDDKTTKDSEDVENNSHEKTVPEMEKRSGADISRVDNVAAILGIATSITAMLALNS